MDKDTPKVFACDKCRALKIRCSRSKGSEQPCTKCTKSNTPCIVSPPKRPAKRARRSKPRIADLSSKIDGILDLLSGAGTAAHPVLSDAHDTRPELAVGASPSVHDQVDGTNLHDGGPGATMENSFAEEHPSTTTDTVVWQDEHGQFTTPGESWATRLGLSAVALEHLLDEFRNMQLYYPFVVMSHESTAAAMMVDRPFLLLAAVTAAASKYPQLQKTLTHEFTDILATRAVVAGDKSLDLLQGLLVHLAWFHFHWIPRSHQAYRLMQIAISMVIDLGLDQPAETVLDERADVRLQRSSSETSTYSQHEGCRAYLGAFYLSTMYVNISCRGETAPDADAGRVSSSTGKPNNMPFSEYMVECAEALRRRSEVETDSWLRPLIDLQRIEEDARSLYRMEKPLSNRSRLHTHAERLSRNLKAWRCALPESLCHPVVTFAYQGVRLRIHEMGLIYRFTSHRRLVVDPDGEDGGNSGSSSVHPTLITNLINSVDAAKEYMDCFLALSLDKYHLLPLEAWTRLAVAPFVLYKLSVGFAEVPEWDVHIARETVDLERYLHVLADRLRSTQTDSNLPRDNPGEDLYHTLPNILDSARSSFVSVRDQPRFRNAVQAHYNLGAAKGAKESGATSTFAFRRSRCPATSHLASRAASVDYDNAAFSPKTPEGILSAEIATIENEKLWNDLMTLDESMTSLLDGLEAPQGAA